MEHELHNHLIFFFEKDSFRTRNIIEAYIGTADGDIIKATPPKALLR